MLDSPGFNGLHGVISQKAVLFDTPYSYVPHRIEQTVVYKSKFSVASMHKYTVFIYNIIIKALCGYEIGETSQPPALNIRH
jgi:hypothetical protein